MQYVIITDMAIYNHNTQCVSHSDNLGHDWLRLHSHTPLQ